MMYSQHLVGVLDAGDPEVPIVVQGFLKFHWLTVFSAFRAVPPAAAGPAAHDQETLLA
jgi:hypothetical protein